MLKISLCDDDKRMLDQIEEMVNKYCINCGMKAMLSRYTSGEEFLEKANIKDIDVLFLDIEMQEINGLGVAGEVRKVNDFAELIFITSYDEYMKRLFSYNVSGYLSKPINEVEFTKVLDQVRENIFKRGEKFFFRIGNQEKNVFKHEIIYMESDRHTLIMHLNEGRCEKFTATLQNVKEQLNVDFVQINRSNIINMNYLRVFNLNEVQMSDNTVIPISENYRLEVMKSYFKFKEKSGNI